MVATLQLNAPGVPPLIGGVSIQLPPLLTADTILGYGANAAQQWGVFLGGAPVIVFDTFVSIDYRQGWSTSDYPIEQGGFESYNKVQIPFDVRVKFAAGGSEENRAALLASVAAIAGDLKLYSVVTPEKVYTSVNVQHYDYHRTSTNGVGMITIEMWLLEIRTTVSEASTTSSGTPAADQTTSQDGTMTQTKNITITPVNPQNPWSSSPSNDGTIQPTDTGNIISNDFSALGLN